MGTIPYNVNRGTVRIKVANVGFHKTREYIQLYDFPAIQQQVYYNPCSCNELTSLDKRHILDRIAKFQPGNEHYQQLRRNLLDMARMVKTESYTGKVSFSEVMKETRKKQRGRYTRAFENLRDNRILVNSKLAILNSFIKFEKWDSEKVEKGKPARSIQFRSYEYLYLCKAYMLPIVKALKETDVVVHGQPLRSVFTKNFDNPGIAAVLRESWDSLVDPIAVCLDHSKFDGHYDIDLLKIEHEHYQVFNSCRFFKYLLSLQLHNSGVTANGIRYKCEGIRASGEYTTSEGNGRLNYCMIKTYLDYLGIKDYRIHVNGDDSVVMVEREFAQKVSDNVDYFNNFNMETEIEMVAEHFPQITFCQASPIRVNDGNGGILWKMVKTPVRAMSRMAFAERRYIGISDRYMAGVGLCELACAMGVPVLQAHCCRVLSWVTHSRPLGSIEKAPAQDALVGELSILPVLDETREDFELAFGISIPEQIEFENLSGAYQNTPEYSSVKLFISKHKKFITKSENV